jgi:rubrerythrin
MGGWLAGMAWMEAASIRSFERLACELEAHGAPKWLAREARRAARDETRHARAMRKLAHEYGASVPRVRLSKRPVRSLEAIARENAVEGCVHETWGALEATVQSEHATDPRIRTAMKQIAPDEKRHAALALAVAEWIEPKLTDRARERVARAKTDAEKELVRKLDRPVPSTRVMPQTLARSLFG